jgi:hypothetical protein
MNAIKHEPKRLFDEPPVLISTWEELSKLETDTHRIEVNFEFCCGRVRPKFELTDDDDYYRNNEYLSTHTFYSSTYSYYTRVLRELGFNIQLANWDGETIYCKN